MRAVPAPKRVVLSNRREAVERRYHLFAAAFIENGGNINAAAKAAGYRHSLNLDDHPQLVALIKKLRDEAAAKAEVTAARVLQEYKDHVDFDKREVFNADGTVKPIKEWTAAQAKQVEELVVEEEYRLVGKGKRKKRVLVEVRTVKLKFAKRLQVTDMGMRRHGLYAKDSLDPNAQDPDNIAARVRAKVSMLDRQTSGGGR